MLVKAKPKIYFKNTPEPPEPSATEYVQSPNSFIESKTLQKIKIKSRFEHFYFGACWWGGCSIRHTCTDLPLSHRESDSLNH